MKQRNFWMRNAALLLTLAAMSLLAVPAKAAGPTRVVTDMVGRRLTVPVNVHRVLGMSPMGTILVYTIDPTALIGWNHEITPGERALLVNSARNLPVVGGWFGKDNTGNIEKIMAAHPDVLISMGDPMGEAQAERVQAQTHIPVYVIKGGFGNLPEAYRRAGELLHREQRANMLAADVQHTIDEIKQKVSRIPQQQRRRYYYAEGPKGLETEPGGTMHVESLDFAGGMNVAAGVAEQKGYGHSPVSLEQILGWNPDIIITGYDHTSWPGEFYSSVWKDSRWQPVKAVRNHAVFETPQYPFCWIDRPPSANRIIGIKWLANLFYPELFHYDMRRETRDFYEKFYQVKLTEQQLNDILAYAVPRPGAKR
ncbi:MAG: ABC transporter substrate-binding protein [Acidobacteriota bacterium]|nr:ABC transporter substrate-binding protein [Acidobacteriota bacterium]